jgi:hypothetical protein
MLQRCLASRNSLAGFLVLVMNSLMTDLLMKNSTEESQERKEVRTMIFYSAAVLGFVIGLPGEVFFWTLDTVKGITDPEICRPADQTVGDYLVKGHWTEAPWRSVCKE